MDSRQSLSATALQLMNAGRLAEARVAAAQAVEGLSVCSPAHGLLAMILLQLEERQAATEVIAHAAGLHAAGLQEAGLQGAGLQGAVVPPSSVADAYDALAYVSLQLGLHERSNELYRRAAEVAPREARFWYNLATSERSFGRLTAAEEACQRAIDVNRGSYQSYLLRSELCVQSAASNHVDELLKLLSDPRLDDRGRMFLSYAVAKELDDLGRYDEAFRWFQIGAGTRRRHLSYDVAVDEAKMARIASTFTTEVVRSTDADVGASSRHVFVIGLPRSGTTLVERILTGHAGVRSNGETDNFAKALLGRLMSSEGDVFARAAAVDPAEVGRRYAVLAGGAGGADGGNVSANATADGGSKIIEKLPMNYLYLGAIARALPGAQLVLLRRDPLDSCFAMYRTLFAAAYPFSYDLQEVARYYAAYERLMRHWRECLGERLFEVGYEELVAQPEAVGARLAAFCGIEWNSRALAVEKNTGVSLTASAAQVRRPIYGSSSGRWRHYRRGLAPLIEALTASGVGVATDAV
jgi:tetratricopeptide (TPR) repeat protein